MALNCAGGCQALNQVEAEMMKSEERVDSINEMVDQAITKLRIIRRLASKGGLVSEYHHRELTEILQSLRHHTDQQARENGFTL
jgi:hypothetical protein